MTPVKKSLTIILILCCLLIPGSISRARGEEHVYHELVIKGGRWFNYSEPSHKGDIIEFSVELDSGGEIDVYLLDHAEYIRYAQNETFRPIRSYTSATNASEEYETGTDTSYHLVVDNRDNGDAHDAQPQGDVEVTISVEYREGDDFIMDGPVILGVMGLLLVVLLVLAVLVARKPANSPPKKAGKRMPGKPKPPRFAGQGKGYEGYEVYDDEYAEETVVYEETLDDLQLVEKKEESPGRDEKQAEPGPKSPAAPPKPQKVEAPTPEEKPASLGSECSKCGGTMIFGKCFNCGIDLKEEKKDSQAPAITETKAPEE